MQLTYENIQAFDNVLELTDGIRYAVSIADVYLTQPSSTTSGLDRLQGTQCPLAIVIVGNDDVGPFPRDFKVAPVY